MFRGGPSLVGIAEGKLASKLALLWNFKTDGPVRSSPAVVAGVVYIGSADANLYALSLGEGAKKWAVKSGGAIESSPLVLGGKVFVGSSDNSLYAVDAASGKQVWKYQTGEKILGAPNWTKAGDQTRVIVGSYDFKLHCVDAESGKAVWTYESGSYINGSPAVADGKAVFGGCDAMLHVLSLADGKQ